MNSASVAVPSRHSSSCSTLVSTCPTAVFAGTGAPTTTAPWTAAPSTAKPTSQGDGKHSTVVTYISFCVREVRTLLLLLSCCEMQQAVHHCCSCCFVFESAVTSIQGISNNLLNSALVLSALLLYQTGTVAPTTASPATVAPTTEAPWTAAPSTAKPTGQGDGKNTTVAHFLDAITPLSDRVSEVGSLLVLLFSRSRRHHAVHHCCFVCASSVNMLCGKRSSLIKQRCHIFCPTTVTNRHWSANNS
jgi:hypothetical protein